MCSQGHLSIQTPVHAASQGAGRSFMRSQRLLGRRHDRGGSIRTTGETDTCVPATKYVDPTHLAPQVGARLGPWFNYVEHENGLIVADENGLIVPNASLFSRLPT